MDPDARKGRVADVALGRLQSSGFAQITLDDVARAADLCEADARALFRDTEGLIHELVSPLLGRLKEIATSAAAVDLHNATQLRELIGRYLDALVAHRALVGVVLRDPTAASSASVRQVRDTVRCLRDELARATGGDLDHRIRAACAMGAVQDAVLELTEVDPTTVRDVIIEAAVAILLS
jgi:AcrR family transcriptional regulator